MDSRRFRVVMELFERACDMEAGARGEFLSNACRGDADLRGAVEKLIQADARSRAGKAPIAEGEGAKLIVAELSSKRAACETVAGAPSTAGPAPERLGNYRVIRKIGEGGMGVVYLGVQDNPRREVALKVLKPGLTTAAVFRRFEHEAMLLGWLQHPGIAQVYEAKTGDDESGAMPFIAMEYVRGRPLSEWMKTVDTRSTLDDRLRLFVRICDAVAYAHQRCIIHRDLKPSNILVTDSNEPKILDFGVARLVDPDAQFATRQTGAGEVIGTLAYMSPEQVAGESREVDTRSDVYSLGIILYELATGRHPHPLREHSWLEAARIVRDVNPEPASSINLACRGDLETIILKALAKEKTRRYQSADELAADIRRYLSHEPVLARPPSAWYHLSKYARRNRGMFIGAALALVALVAGSIATATFAWRESREAARATAQAQRAKATVEFLANMLSSADPYEARGKEITVRQILDDASKRLASGALSGQPEVEAALRGTIGRTYFYLGRPKEARPHVEAALAALRALHGPHHEDVLDTLWTLSSIEKDEGRYEESQRLSSEVLRAAQAMHGDNHPRVAQALNDLAVAVADMGRIEESLGLHMKALSMRQQWANANPMDLAISLGNVGSALQSLGRLEEAEPCLREALAIRRRYLPPDHPMLATVMNNLGCVLRDRGNMPEAEATLAEALAIRRRVLPKEHSERAVSLANLASVHERCGRAEEAVILLREAVSIHERVGDPLLGTTMMRLMSALEARGDPDEAIEVGRKAVQITRRSRPAGHPDIPTSLHNLGVVLKRRGVLGEAEARLREGLEILMQHLPQNHPTVAHFQDTLGTIFIEQQRNDEAIVLLEKALAVRRRSLPPGHVHLGLTTAHLALAKFRKGDLAGAGPLAKEAIEILRACGEHATELEHAEEVWATCERAGQVSSE